MVVCLMASDSSMSSLKASDSSMSSLKASDSSMSSLKASDSSEGLYVSRSLILDVQCLKAS